MTNFERFVDTYHTMLMREVSKVETYLKVLKVADTPELREMINDDLCDAHETLGVALSNLETTLIKRG